MPILIITTNKTIRNFTEQYWQPKSITLGRKYRCMSEKTVIELAISINIYYFFLHTNFVLCSSDSEKDTLTFNTSGKEFQVNYIYPLSRAQYFVLDLFTRKILIWLLDLVSWLWILLLRSKCDYLSSAILWCNNWKM